MSHVVLPCPACKNLNRVPTERLGDVPVCATCRTRLLGATIDLGDADFDKVVRSTDLPVVVDFWAAWCGPCRTMAPHFAAAAQQLAGRFVFAKVDTEAATRTAQLVQWLGA